VIRLCPSLKRNLDWKSPEVWVFVWWESQFTVESRSHEFMRVDQVWNWNEVCIRGIRLWHAMHCCYVLYDQTVFEAITQANFCSLSNDGFEAIVFSATQFPFNQICNTRFIFVTRQISWVQIIFFHKFAWGPEGFFSVIEQMITWRNGMMSILEIYWMGQYRNSVKIIFSFSEQKEGGMTIAHQCCVVGRV